MPINDPFARPTVRQPRVRILNNGTPIDGVIQAEVTNNNYYQADTFTAQIAINKDPVFTPQWWSNQKQILLDIQFSLDNGNTWKSFIVGQVDHLAVHMDAGILAVDGRDLTAYFIDTKTRNAYVNQTSSQIVQKLAAKHGLTADVTPTTTLVGHYYGVDHEHVTLNQFAQTTTEWNLLCSLAQHEQFDVYVTRNTLHFHASTPPNSDPWDLVWQDGGVTGGAPWMSAASLTMERSMPMAKDVVVVVRSWDSRTGAGVTAVSPAGADPNTEDDADEQRFDFVVGGLSQAAAQALADRQLEQITRHERVITVEAPGDLIVGPRNMLRVRGTNSLWDQTYYIDWVRRSMHFDGGFKMSIHAKNRSPQTESATNA